MLNITTVNKSLETRNLKFTRKNLEKIAYHYDAEIVKIDNDIKVATLKDHHGRLFWVEELSSYNLRRSVTTVCSNCGHDAHHGTECTHEDVSNGTFRGTCGCDDYQP